MMETTTIVGMNSFDSSYTGIVYEMRWDPDHKTINIKLMDSLFDEKRKKTIVIVGGEDMSMFDADIKYMQDFIRNAITGELDDSVAIDI